MQRSCRHLLVDEFQDLTPAHVLLLRLLVAARRSTSSASATTTSASTATPAPTRRSSSTTTRCSPAPRQHPLHVNYRCPVAVVDGARTLLGYNHRRVAKEIDAGPTDDRPPTGALRGRRARAATTAPRALVETCCRAGSPSRASEPSSIAVLARVNSLLLAPARRACTRPACRSPRCCGPTCSSAPGMRAALAYLRIATDPGGLDPRDVVEILRRPTRGLPQWFPERLDRRPRWTRRRQLAGLADQVSATRTPPKVLRLVDDLRMRRRRRPRRHDPRRCSRSSATTSAWGRR